MMARPKLDSDNWDKSAVRLWLVYQFWTPANFAANNNISVRHLRHLLTLGCPFFGRAHKGAGGIRLSKSAATWLLTYRALTVDGTFRFSGMPTEFLEDLALAVNDEALAYWKLYDPDGPRPDDSDLDEFLSKRAAAAERRSWKTSFRELKKPA